MEIEHLSSVDQTRADLEQQHEEVIIAMKQDYDNQINQQQQLINVSEAHINHFQSLSTGWCSFVRPVVVQFQFLEKSS